MTTPGRYSTMQQSIQLQPQAFYRLEAEVKGNTAIYVRARISKRQGEKPDAYSAWTQPGEEFKKHVVYFPTGETTSELPPCAGGLLEWNGQAMPIFILF